MSIVDLFLLSCVVAVFGGLPAVAVALYLDRKNVKSGEALAARIDH